MEYLHKNGLSEASDALEEESNVTRRIGYENNDTLSQLLLMTIDNLDHLWDSDVEKCVRFSRYQNKDLYLLQDSNSILINEFDHTDIEEIDLWNDEPDSEDTILYVETETTKKGGTDTQTILAATIPKLIEKLTTPSSSNYKILPIFLMTYQSFLTPGKLLYLLIKKYNVPSWKKNSFLFDEEFLNWKYYIQFRIVQILKFWLTEHFSDFNRGLLDIVIQFINSIGKNLKMKNQKNQLLNIIKMKLNNDNSYTITNVTKNDNYTENNYLSRNTPEPKVPKNIFSKNLTLFDIDELEIARQITLIDFEIFSQIKPTELLNCTWSKPTLKHRAKNVLKLIERFNRMSDWAANLILRKQKAKKRAKVFSKFITIVEHLLKLNNYNSVISLISGLQSSPIYRLSKTLKEIPTKQFEFFNDTKQLLSSEGSFKTYRKILKQSSTPCIPYLGVYLTDLIFIEDGNPDYIKNNLINFARRSLVYEKIAEIQKYQIRPYNLHHVHQISILLKDFKKFDKNQLYNLSLKIEPRKVRK